MRWWERRRSGNVEDRRGIPTRGLAVGGGLGTVVLLLLAVVMGVDPRNLVQPMPPGGDLGSSERQIRWRTNWRISCPSCWLTPKTYGISCSARKGVRIEMRSSCCLRAKSNRPAALPVRRSVPSIVRETKGLHRSAVLTTSSNANSVHRAILHKPM